MRFENLTTVQLEKLVDIFIKAYKAGGEIFGGFVRDIYYGIEFNDIDIRFSSWQSATSFSKSLGKLILSEKTSGIKSYGSVPDMAVIKIVCEIDTLYLQIDCVYPTKNMFDSCANVKNMKYSAGYFRYDFSVNTYSLVLRNDKLNGKIDIENFWENFMIAKATYAEKSFKEELLQPDKSDRSFLISHTISKKDTFMRERLNKLLMKGFTPINYGTCYNYYCNCLLQSDEIETVRRYRSKLNAILINQSHKCMSDRCTIQKVDTDYSINLINEIIDYLDNPTNNGNLKKNLLENTIETFEEIIGMKNNISEAYSLFNDFLTRQMLDNDLIVDI